MLLELLGVVALLFGLFFCGVGVLGVIRMPDALTRLHASGKVATLGLFGLLVGAALLMPAASLRILALGLFVLLTSPVATHAIAASVYRRQEILEELFEMRDEQVDVTAVDVSGILSRSLIQDIIEAQQRTHRPTEGGPTSNDN
ncbi:MAG: monovalent cation/H(+) antiporter subunit G [Chloroflexi bacterium]|nr:monovalent cation/H(+) antiporter subunit G [Chloroflexota bacterium]